MYLTKLALNLKKAQARACVMDCQAMHRNIMELFGTSRVDSHVLYRLNLKTNCVYVMSAKMPVIKENSVFHLVTTKDMGERLKFKEGNVFSFNLLTMPSKKDMTTKKRKYLYENKDVSAWLQRKSNQHGFTVLTFDSMQKEKLFGTHFSEKGGKFELIPTEITGLLRVDDVEKFADAYSFGIGNGKAYGMGMLLLKVSSR